MTGPAATEAWSEVRTVVRILLLEVGSARGPVPSGDTGGIILFFMAVWWCETDSTTQRKLLKSYARTAAVSTGIRGWYKLRLD